MKILGIDPGLVNTGFGIISHAKKIEVLDYGIISPDIKTELSVRLNTIYNDTKLLIKKYLPDCLSIEEVFYSNNVKTTMKLGQARGAVLIAAAEFDLDPLLKDLKNNRPLRLALRGGFSELPIPPYVVKEWRSIHLENEN